MRTFFDEQFDGPTERFSTPHVVFNAPHPYTDSMVLRCLRGIGNSGQSRITRNCRVYVEGAMLCPFASCDLVQRIAENESIRDVDWSRLFDGREFLIFINRAALYVPEMLTASKAFVGAFDCRFGRSGISIEHHVIIGRYAETSFGVHIDDPTDRVFHFNLGPHTKSMSLWPRMEFLAAYGGDVARLRRNVDHAEPATYAMPPGSSFFLPADYHHVGSSDEGVSLVVALAFSRQSKGLLLDKALRELCDLVPSRTAASDYYGDFTASPADDEDDLLTRYDRVGLHTAHRHALARRLSNNSFDEITEVSVPSIEAAVGTYVRVDARVEIVEANEGVYVYSSGHRAFLVSKEQIRDLHRLLAADGFAIGADLGLDAEALALRAWLVATGAARRLGDNQGGAQ
ncbi:MAG TPA: hypothetical protein VNZ61_14070 [Roseomonas sp.]|nr:hypothetical protein [Roseomonas sp.]